ncbi:hypothetical protein AGR13a_Cc170057 [Agrobacterium genomosp. 13 str. CFBP 6927]|uniref:Transposase n=1 Tax=Agrobacterium genomosp. 13 str. CFBP 6927 TaxID=1183428 RepID=A0ABP2BCL0_9HYPH|nr:hypothetical protein AGR13a_Cc170057 [Agrobacterium genomosp. 13 str. CFBP 6927]
MVSSLPGRVPDLPLRLISLKAHKYVATPKWLAQPRSLCKSLGTISRHLPH